MRMWMVDPGEMCRQHLLGEHSEIHKHRHNFVKGHNISGRIEGNAVEPEAMQERHDALVSEMLKRGYKHNSPYEQPDLSKYPIETRQAKVNIQEARKLLEKKCLRCLQQRVKNKERTLLDD